jgi:transposase
VRRVDRADRGAVPGAPRPGGHDPRHRGRKDAAGRWQRAFADIGAHRVLQASDAAKGLLHPAAAKVIATLNNEWDGLARRQELPQLPLDNNISERALRNPVIGRKNFYGSGARWAADLAADIWTITATAAQNDLEPLALLEDHLSACAQAGGTAPAGADLEPFLPWTPQGRARRAVPADALQGPAP